jgi:hypothetical protein
MKGTRTIEPWFDAYQQALRAQQQPLIYLLVSYAELQRLAAGRLPMNVRRQADRALNAVPGLTPPANGGHP